MTSQEIANHLLSDPYSYGEFIQEMTGEVGINKDTVTKIIEHLDTSLADQTYWEAWFMGAEREDLELANRGIRYIPK